MAELQKEIEETLMFVAIAERLDATDDRTARGELLGRAVVYRLLDGETAHMEGAATGPS